MTDKTRSPRAWAHDRRQDDWAITPKIQQPAKDSNDGKRPTNRAYHIVVRREKFAH